jgi:hypothetical protein
MKITRAQVLAFRCRAQHLDERLPEGAHSLRTAARIGLQDSVPRSALHSLHARVEGVGPSAWEDPALVQVWGPRYTAYVVPAGDHAIFTLARLPDRGRIRDRAYELSNWLSDRLGGRAVDLNDVSAALGSHPNQLRYASLTGTVIIRWAGARRPYIQSVPPPEIEPAEARAELARRYLHAYGPSTAAAFAEWAGIAFPAARETFGALEPELQAATTPTGDGWMLAEDEALLRASRPRTVRLLPSGDPYYLLQGDDRELLVPDALRRAELWTSRVWPGALLVDGEIVGTWRRTKAVVTVEPWRRLSSAERDALDAEAASLPIPGSRTPTTIRWP